MGEVQKESVRKKKIIQFALLAFGLLLIVGGTSYAFINFLFEGTKEHSITTDGLNFTFTESNAVVIDNAFPMSDTEGLANGGNFTFSVSAKTTTANNIKYIVYITPDATNTIANNYARMQILDGNQNVLRNPIDVSNMESYMDKTNAYVLYYNEFNLTGAEVDVTTHSYSLRFWLNESYKDSINYTESGTSHTGSIDDATYAFKVNIATVGKVYDNNYGI